MCNAKAIYFPHFLNKLGFYKLIYIEHYGEFQVFYRE